MLQPCEVLIEDHLWIDARRTNIESRQDESPSLFGVESIG